MIFLLPTCHSITFILLYMMTNDPATPSSKFKADIYLLLITIIWGASFVAVKAALDFSSPFLFLTMRFFLATAILFVLFRQKIREIDPKTLKAGLFVGLLVGIGYGSQTLGLVYTSASKSAFITGTFVILVPIFSIVFEKIVPRKLLWVGVAFAVTGLYLLTSPEEGEFNIGDKFTALGAVAFGAHTVALQIYSKRYDFIQLTFLQVIVTGFIGLISTLLFETPRFEANFTLISIITGTAIFPTVFCFYILTKYQRYTSSTRAAIIYSFEPVAGALFAYLILGEILGIRGLYGAILIFFGMIISELKKRKTVN